MSHPSKYPVGKLLPSRKLVISFNDSPVSYVVHCQALTSACTISSTKWEDTLSTFSSFTSKDKGQAVSNWHHLFVYSLHCKCFNRRWMEMIQSTHLPTKDTLACTPSITHVRHVHVTTRWVTQHMIMECARQRPYYFPTSEEPAFENYYS